MLIVGTGVAFGSTDTVPSLPASYYGKILAENNQTLNGILVAKINGTERGQIEVINNMFGGLSYTDSKLVVNGRYNDDEGKEVEFYFNGVKLNSTRTVYWHSGDVVELTLLYGNVSIPNNPPVADFSYSIIGDVNDGKDVQFNDNSSDSDGTITKWLWNFGDGTASNNENPSHVYHSAGVYNVSLTVWDDDGANNTIQKTLTITNTPPKADFTYSVNYLNVTFMANASDDGIIKSYIWNFGDGTTGTGESISHSYINAGTYTVTLTVIDNLGAKNITKKQITVVKPVDFEMNNIIVPSSIYAGNEYTIYGKIYSNDAKTVEIAFYVNGSLHKLKNKSLVSGTNYVAFKWKPSHDGTYNLKIKIDPNNKINETNEANNELTKLVKVSSVDYGVYAIHKPYSTTVNKSTGIAVVLTSTKYSQNVPLLIKAVDINGSSEIIFDGNISIWNYKYFYTNWKPSHSGTYIIIANIDPNNIIQESNENNNKKSVNITVSKPDLRMGWTNLPYRIIVNKTVTPYLSVYSNTPLNATVVIKVNETGEVLYNKTVYVNYWKYLHYNWTPTTNNSYHIVAVIDPYNHIDEQNENNNKLVRKVIVTKPDLRMGWTNLPYRIIVNKTVTPYLSVYSNTPLNATVVIKVNETGEVLYNKTVYVNYWKYLHYNWTPTTNNTYHIVAVIDPYNHIDEQNENNNKLVRKVIVENPYFKITGKYCPTVVKEGNYFYVGIYYKTNYKTNYTLYLNYNHTIFNSSQWGIKNDTLKGYTYPTGWWSRSIWIKMKALHNTDNKECINGTLILNTLNGTLIKNLSCCIEVQPQGVIMKSSNITKLNGNDNKSFNLTVYNATPIRKVKGTIELDGGSDGAIFKGLYFLNKIPNAWGCIEQIASPTLANIYQKKYYYDMNNIDDGGALLNKTKKNVKIGIDTIISRQRNDGSWQWWGHGKSSVYFSAYSIYTMSLAYNDHDFRGISGNASKEKAVIENGVKWLISNQSSDGSWRAIPGAHEYIRQTIPLTAWTMTSLAEARDATDNNTLKSEINNSLEKGANFLLKQNLTKTEEISMSMIALNRTGFNWANISGNMSSLATKLKNKQSSDGHWNPDLWSGWAYWEPETTGYSILALHYAGYPNNDSNVSAGMDYLLTHFNPGWGWGSTKQTATAVQTIVIINPNVELNSNVSVYVDGNLITNVSLTKKTPHAVVNIPSSNLAIGNHKITLKSTGSGKVVASGLIKQWVLYGDVPEDLKQYIDPIAENYSLKVSTSSSKAYVDEPIKITAIVNNSNNSNELRYVFFEIKLPSNTTFTNATDESGNPLVFEKNETTGNYYVAIGDIANKSIYKFYFNATVHKPSIVNFTAKIYQMYKPDEIAISNITNLEVVSRDISINASIPTKTYNSTISIPTNITYDGVGSENITITVKLDNSTVKEENTTINPGSNLLNISLENITEGNHTVELYAGVLPDEINTENNKVVGAITVESPENKFVDVCVENISINGSNIIEGNNYTVNIGIKNIGNANASNAYVALYANGTLLNNKSINISSNSSKYVSFTWTPSSSGNYTLSSEVTLINDSDVSNNNKNITVYVKPQTVVLPDLIVESISTPSEITVNKTVTVNITIKNIGNANATKFSLRLSDSNNNTIDLKQNITLNVNESKTFSFNWTPTTEGNITLIAGVDGNNAVFENNETNNVMNKTVTVKSSYIKGDVTGDGIVDAGDAIKILRYDAGLITNINKQAGDVTGDGIVDAGDAIKILRYDAGLISHL
ncbi:CARDB domain-containing protein [Methanothermococcus okinawensis]|uniref:CARDB domain-containing protein n=1 Tax=Methanothermococcus okinawensis TaxID=155863 RepID=UPI0018DCDB33|nr:CARDB domain-containing protein [Methanothermococcus okinawensis]